uniref:Non-specific serine/threonine protein kinase n=1 Tax=Rhizophora mucronata TaxID=61149 RepID=A0A2P2P203_RHIMU
MSPGVLDSQLVLEDESNVCHMITVLKIALLCTSTSSLDRPTMREVVLMLIESSEQGGHHDSSPSHEANSSDELIVHDKNFC